MKKDQHNKAERFWDRTAGSYDKEEQKHKKTYHLVIEKLKGYLQPTHIVLDFGCGTGLIANEITKSVKEIHAIDISAKMIELATIKAKKQHIDNIQYTQATVHSENLKASTYDVILAFHILHLVEDASLTIQRIKELLKPGGIFISVTPCMADKPFFSGLLSLFGSIGIVPKITSFNYQDLQNLLADEKLTIVESEKLAGTSNQYFIVGKK
ncbi:MAG: methyltransferase domain-containing protein [Cyclobacteriaceae bacterium]